MIFEHFDLQPGSPTIAQTRKDLLSAAKACKAFSVPALSSLWRILPSLLPLLLLLPSAEVSNNHYVSPRPLLYLFRRLIGSKFVDRLPLGSNWERFDLYAPRVRTLYMERLRVVISPHVYLRIRSLRRHRDAPLLPGLKEIYIPNETSLDFSAALLLSSESSLNLVHLDNSAMSDRQFCIPFLFLLSVNSPNLTHLALCGTADTALELVPCFKSLQSLELRLSGTDLNSRILRDLGKLDNLLEMTLDTSPSIHAPTTPSDPTPPLTNFSFIQLRKLRILGTPSSMSRILNEMDGLTNLTTLIIHEKGHDTEGSWSHCFAIISTFPAIEDIEITQSWRYPYPLSTLCFYPLCKLNNMTSFVINNFTLSGSDEDFRFLTCSFPKLKKFVEPCTRYGTEGKTLACLFDFSQANQNLQELKISLGYDISENLKAISLYELGCPIIQNHHHPLEKLYITSSNFESMDLPDMIQVAQFLDLIFPNLSTLEAYGSYQNDVSNWTKIQQIRVALQAARNFASQNHV